MTVAVLSVRRLCFDDAGQAVFADWSAEFGAGVTWIVGTESSGKTTLLRLLAGVLHGTGEVAVHAPGATSDPPFAWYDVRDERFDAVGVTAFFDRARRAHPAFDDAVLARHVAGFGLEPHLEKALYQLSTGSRRKVGLAASLSAGAAVTLLDDPTAALDGASVAHLMRTLAEVADHPARAWIVTGHDRPPALAAARFIELPERR